MSYAAQVETAHYYYCNLDWPESVARARLISNSAPFAGIGGCIMEGRSEFSERFPCRPIRSVCDTKFRPKRECSLPERFSARWVHGLDGSCAARLTSARASPYSFVRIDCDSLHADPGHLRAIGVPVARVLSQKRVTRPSRAATDCCIGGKPLARERDGRCPIRTHPE
jgi:hypothetical protein